MSALRRIDDFLIDRVFQPASDWLVDHAGIGPLSVACACNGAWAVLTYVDYQTGNGMGPREWLMMAITIISFWITVFYLQGLPSLRHSMRNFFMIFRIFGLFTVGMDMVGMGCDVANDALDIHRLVDHTYFGIDQVGNYFMICEPKKPKPKKRKESVGKLAAQAA